MSLLGTLTELQPGLSEVMLSSPGLGPALEFSLLHTPEKLVRKGVAGGVLRMARDLRPSSKVLSAVRTVVPACWLGTYLRYNNFGVPIGYSVMDVKFSWEAQVAR